MTHYLFRLGFHSIVSHQEQTEDNASNIGCYRQITGNLGRGSIRVCIDVDSLDGQKCEIGVQHYRCLGCGLDLITTQGRVNCDSQPTQMRPTPRPVSS